MCECVCFFLQQLLDLKIDFSVEFVHLMNEIEDMLSWLFAQRI